ncbi:putative apurinic-apyrimidinic endonuclease 1 [Salmon gill poxvirus]|uniref:Putative apurinic-apyrimidinic endonuclease 1 n=1 Tax=Salmon gill poxvirus TaxID=1680908 RepID=A0A0H4Y162_9POXV|nr:putative apurinic-apyrimidinic endonuclease 1 [Salmon gill poxvirus]AKR04245.1 putative apurinic-apyrimidinic endonuclease 1 [Salmon gill poxvirus]WMX26528.1 putative apurinic-apyrimidinic endonuclease 1 [Salmon gill poxvirus]
MKFQNIKYKRVVKMYITYGCVNINGIGASVKKGLMSIIKGTNFDVYFLQETKSDPTQEFINDINELGYRLFINSSTQSGRAGVCILIKEIYKDRTMFYNYQHLPGFKGRVSMVKIDTMCFFNVYLPFSSSYDSVEWESKITIVKKLHDEVELILNKGHNAFICGDFNLIYTGQNMTITDSTGFFHDVLSHAVTLKIHTTPAFMMFLDPLISELKFKCADNMEWDYVKNDDVVTLSSTTDESNLTNVLNNVDLIKHMCNIYDVKMKHDFSYNSSTLATIPNNIRRLNGKSTYLQQVVLECLRNVIPMIPLGFETKSNSRIDHVYSTTPTVAFVDANIKISDHQFIYGAVFHK